MKVTTYDTTKARIINAPLPEDTRTYKRITNEELINLTLESIYGAGFSLQSERYTMARDGDIANGMYSIRNVADSEMQLNIAWQNSYNKQLTLKYCLGVKIFVCENGGVSGDMGAFKRKHTGDVQEFTPKHIIEYIKTAGDVFADMQRQRERLKQIEITKRTAAELIGRAYIENQFINTTQLNIIKSQFEKPLFDYGAPGSLWELYQWITYSLKNDHPSNWMQDHLDTHNFILGAAEFLSSDDTYSELEEMAAVEDKRQLKLFPEIFG